MAFGAPDCEFLVPLPVSISSPEHKHTTFLARASLSLTSHDSASLRYLIHQSKATFSIRFHLLSAALSAIRAPRVILGPSCSF
eukprot:41080-Eustigmatos_ZCMA.PRE.2